MLFVGTKVKVGTEQLDYGEAFIIENKFAGTISGKQYQVYSVKLLNGKILQVAENLLTIMS